MLADHGRELEAVEIRHAHIDEDERDLVLEQTLEGLARRGGLEQVLADLGEHDLVAQQLRLLSSTSRILTLSGRRLGR